MGASRSRNGGTGSRPAWKRTTAPAQSGSPGGRDERAWPAGEELAAHGPTSTGRCPREAPENAFRSRAPEEADVLLLPLRFLRRLLLRGAVPVEPPPDPRQHAQHRTHRRQPPPRQLHQPRQQHAEARRQRPVPRPGPEHQPDDHRQPADVPRPPAAAAGPAAAAPPAPARPARPATGSRTTRRTATAAAPPRRSPARRPPSGAGQPPPAVRGLSGASGTVLTSPARGTPGRRSPGRDDRARRSRPAARLARTGAGSVRASIAGRQYRPRAAARFRTGACRRGGS